jgi:hypothetical protein
MIGAFPARLKLPSQAEEIIISSTQPVFELWYAVGTVEIIQNISE